MNKFLKNPILSGNYPDPSICRVEDDFYMVNSTFSMYPGIPIFHSRDLANWQQIGYVLDRPSQLHLTADLMCGGIMAPTIRFHQGMFYVICANFSSLGNFIVTATNPAGPWSEPVWLPEVTGIDASLFFDDDGRCYISGTRRDKNADGSEGPQVIWLTELNLVTMKPIGEQPTLWGGALKNVATPESPHLYKRKGWYYLIIAEGGTEHFHAVTVARSQTLYVAFQGYEGNPIMTHRHLGRNYPIGNVGHADLVQLKNGDWYAVMLASRLIEGYHKNLGRESFIAPVIWENDWPVFSPGTGKMEWAYPAPLEIETPAAEPVRDDFDSAQLGFQWNFFGTPYQDFYSLQNSQLVIKHLPRPMSPEIMPINRHSGKPDPLVPSLPWIGRRQQHINFRATAKMAFRPQAEYETAGLNILQAFNHQLRMERTCIDGQQVLQLVQVTNTSNGWPFMPGFVSQTREQVIASVPFSDDEIILQITVRGQLIDCFYGLEQDALSPLISEYDGKIINPESIAGFMGAYIGLYACSNGQTSNNQAAFDWFDYEQI